MSLAPFLTAREAIITALKNDTVLNAIIPASRIYPQKTPASPSWPFVRLDSLGALPARFDCAEGSEITGVVHCFSKLSTNVPDPEAQASLVADHISTVLENIADCHVENAQVIMDSAEADAFHGIVQFRLSKV